jgi:hemerythrin-like domain-containing protein
MEIYAKLKADHRRIAKLLDDIEKTTERAVKTRTTLFAELKSLLLAHADAEAATFYTALEAKKLPEKVMMPEAHAEHDVVKVLLAELSSMNCGTVERSGKFLVLKENVEHHVKEEENEIFKDAKKVLDKDESKRIGEEMEAMETRLLRPAQVGKAPFVDVRPV